MTTEEKVKAYLEDLKKAKDLLEKIFTELKESEDERIRKELLAVINDLILPEEQRARFNTWLEKQKANTEGDFGRGYDCGYKACLNSHGAEFFEKQKEQNPIEWSEEDKFKLEDAITGIDVGIGFYETEGKHPNLLNAIIEAKDWLKSLKDRGNFPKSNTNSPSEWSEEDEKMVRFYADDYDNNLGNMPMRDIIENRIKFKDWLLNRLKSLRPSWKPSEEQMKALSETIAFAPDTFKPKCTLVTLQDDLKKLMEE